MKKVPPFHANRADNMSCTLAVYRSIFEYFTHKKLSWEKLEELTGYKEGVAAWTVKALVEMSHKGWDIQIIEPFDYRKYFDEGISYLHKVFPKNVIEWQLNNSNIVEMKKSIPEFLKTIDHKVEIPTLNDIDNLLNDDRLVSVVLNSRALNNKPGYVGHSILIYDSTPGTYIFHDPGLPGISGREESKSNVLNAMGKAADVTGFKLKVRNG